MFDQVPVLMASNVSVWSQSWVKIGEGMQEMQVLVPKMCPQAFNIAKFLEECTFWHVSAEISLHIWFLAAYDLSVNVTHGLIKWGAGAPPVTLDPIIFTVLVPQIYL